MSLPRTIAAALDARLAADPDGPYLDFEGVGLSAREVAAAADHLAACLAEVGVGRGDRIATLLENGPEQVITGILNRPHGAVEVLGHRGEWRADIPLHGRREVGLAEGREQLAVRCETPAKAGD
ncbi:MAG: AMP-binding protein, partial [Acidimicrobiia bacterium]